MRVAIAEDAPLFRELLAGMFPTLGIEVTAQSSTGCDLLAKIEVDPPDVAVVDIRMAGESDGLDAAEMIRSRHPEMGILILSQYCDTAYAVRAASLGDRSVGYLTKDSVDLNTLREALNRIAAGESYFDPIIIQRLLERQRNTRVLNMLSDGELEILRLIAEGRSNKAIAKQLYQSPRTTEGSITEIYRKLEFDHFANKETHNFRVLAVLEWLQMKS
jgi:DNA-binding NarL/FixJ family response regulator